MNTPLFLRTMLAAVLVFFGVFSLTTPAVAEGEAIVTWSVSPSTPGGPDGRTRFDFQAAPSSVISDWVAVTNDSAVVATFSVYAADATTDFDTAAFTLIGSDEESIGAGAWIALDASEITLDPGERANIPFTMTVPQDAIPGDHAAGIVAVYTTTAAGEGVDVARELRVGTRVYLRVDGPLEPAFAVTGQSVRYAGGFNPFAGGEASVDFNITNTGNIRLSAQPTVTLTGPFGIPIAEVRGDVINELVPTGVGHVEVPFDGVPPLLLLFADITLTPVPGEGASAGDMLPAAISKMAMGWAVPWALLGGLALTALIIWGASTMRRRHREQLAAELADYTEQVRAEALAQPELEGADR